MPILLDGQQAAEPLQEVLRIASGFGQRGF
jgi:hypothetical protein